MERNAQKEQNSTLIPRAAAGKKRGKRMKQRYVPYTVQNLLTVTKIVTIHYLELEKDFVSAGESHDFWELVYADRGNVLCTAEDKTLPLAEGEVIFHKPGEFHRLAADTRTAPNVFIVSFCCKGDAVRFFAGKKLRLDKNLLRFVYMIVEESKRTFDLPYSDPGLKKMPLRSDRAPGGDQLLKNLIEILLIGILREQLAAPKEQDEPLFFREDGDGEEEGLAARIVGMLRENIHNSLCIDDLCRRLNYNRSYLFRRFKQSTGRTIMSYFTHLKIERAKRLLRESDLSVSRISELFSFDSPCYFSKTFKKLTGYTPLQYKKIHRLVP